MTPKVTLRINALNGEGIDEAIRAVEEYKTWLSDRCAALSRRLAEFGVTVASARFSDAQYDGDNDVSVALDERGALQSAVIALGNAALFIEFGTGVTYPDDHPEAAANGAIRGAYGKGKGKQRTWGYYGNPGTNGEIRMKKDGRSVVLTHGNPANMPMYRAVRDIEQRFSEIVREVFA